MNKKYEQEQRERGPKLIEGLNEFMSLGIVTRILKRVPTDKIAHILFYGRARGAKIISRIIWVYGLLVRRRKQLKW